jgi:hypothetical protein
LIEFDILLKSAPDLQDGLRLILPGPELRQRYFLFQIGDFLTLMVGVKDTL